MSGLRGGLVGCGYFAQNHLHAWREVEGAEIVAVCDMDVERAERCAADFSIAGIYGDLAAMLADAALGFVDIATQPASHRALVEQVASHGTAIICQKPMAPSLDDGRAMVVACQQAGVPFMVHENFRWQTPMRAVKEAAAEIGELFFAQVSFRSGFDVYTNQPYLATDSRFIIYDLGVHALDLARFFMGDVLSIDCHVQRVNQSIRAEDVATMLLRMESGSSCVVDISYASKLERELFPQTLVRLEGRDGSVVLSADYELTIARGSEVEKRFVPPLERTWSSAPGEAIQDSVVAIQQHWSDCLRAKQTPETSGADNLKTLELVFGAYDSAARGEPYLLKN